MTIQGHLPTSDSTIKVHKMRKKKSMFASLVMLFFFLNYFKTSENLSSYVVFQFHAAFLLPKEDAVLSQN